MKVLKIQQHQLITHLLTISTLLLTINVAQATTENPKPTIRLSEPIEITDTSETFGTPFYTPKSYKLEKPLTLQQLFEGAEKYLNEKVWLNTRIAKVCQKKGCFFIAQDGEKTMRISFKDYSFFIPTNSSGKTVDLIGVLTQKYTSKKKAKHLASDIGEHVDTIDTGFAYEFVASSVRIPVD